MGRGRAAGPRLAGGGILGGGWMWMCGALLAGQFSRLWGAWRVVRTWVRRAESGRDVRCDGARSDGARGCGGGSWPACQSWRICSMRAKMRLRAAMLRVWMGAGIQAHFSCASTVPCRRAIWSPREGACAFMRRMITN